jgi:hypothetical protein
LVSFYLLGLTPSSHAKTENVEKLIRKLEDKHAKVRQNAVDALVAIGPPAVDPLIAALKDADRNVRRLAAEALGRIKDPRAVVPLEGTQRDPDPSVRWNAIVAIVALGNIRDPLDFLIPALKDADSSVRGNAANLLGKVNDPRVVEPLIAALKDADASVQRSALLALSRTKDPRAASPMRAWSSDHITPLHFQVGYWTMIGAGPGTLIEAFPDNKSGGYSRHEYSGISVGGWDECITKDKLASFSAFDGVGESNRWMALNSSISGCTRTVLESTGRGFQVQVHCEEGQAPSDETLVVKDVRSDSVEVTVQLVTSNKTATAKFLATYRGRGCVRPRVQTTSTSNSKLALKAALAGCGKKPLCS